MNPVVYNPDLWVLFVADLETDQIKQFKPFVMFFNQLENKWLNETTRFKVARTIANMQTRRVIISLYSYDVWRDAKQRSYSKWAR